LAFARLQVQQVRSAALDAGGDAVGSAVADGHKGNHGSHTNNDAKDGEGAAQFIG